MTVLVRNPLSVRSQVDVELHAVDGHDRHGDRNPDPDLAGRPWRSVATAVDPSPAAHAIWTVLKAGERVY